LRRSYLLPAFYLLGRRPITIMGVTTDTAITATTIDIITTTIIIVTELGLPLSTVAPATTATIETAQLFELACVLGAFRWLKGQPSRCGLCPRWRTSRYPGSLVTGTNRDEWIQDKKSRLTPDVQVR
jgi:hypothetical protein